MHNHEKKILALTAVIGLLLLTAGCGGGEKKLVTQNREEKVLTVYSARSESLNNAVIPKFEKSYWYQS